MDKGAISASTSAGAAVISWISVFNEVVQVLAGLVALVSGIIFLYDRLIKKRKK